MGDAGEEKPEVKEGGEHINVKVKAQVSRRSPPPPSPPSNPERTLGGFSGNTHTASTRPCAAA
jgi:hypothetical protein